MDREVSEQRAYQLRPTDTSPAGLSRLAGLFAASFGNGALSVEALAWQYCDNPDGRVVGFDALVGEELAAHYATIPMVANLKGHRVKGLLSINTATHPCHQKQGLFTKLAEATYALGIAQGYEFVVGVANDQSVHGFLKRLQFQSVGLLHTHIMARWSRTRKDVVDVIDFERCWSKAAVEWRLKDPRHRPGQYGTFALQGENAIVGRSQRFPVIVGAVPKEATPSDHLAARFSFRPRIWLGLDARTDWRRSAHVRVPERFKSVPLTLIFRDLTDKRTLNADRTCFFAMDFDAY